MMPVRLIVLPLLAALSASVCAEQPTEQSVSPTESEPASLWLDRRLQPVTGAGEAVYRLSEWAPLEDEDGYRIVTRYLTGERRFETHVTSMDFTTAAMFGDYRRYAESGQLIEEGFRDRRGRLQGEATLYGDDGQLQRRLTFKDGKHHGLSTTYHEGRVYRTRQLHQGQRHGVSNTFHPNGQLRSEAHYQHGRSEGPNKRWNDAGQLTSEKHYKNGKVDGKSVEYFDSGEIKAISHYREGQPIGERIEYGEPERVRRRVLYDDDGGRIAEYNYDPEGQLTRSREPVETDYGPGEQRETHFDSGQVQRRSISSHDRHWSLTLRYDELGNLIERNERLDHRRIGRFVRGHWSGGQEFGTYRDGEMHGDYRAENADGEVVVEGRYDQGRKIGPWRTAYPEEQVTEHYNDQGQLHGERVVMNDGQLTERAHYRNGTHHGEFERYQQGELTARGEFRAGARQGFWTIASSYYGGNLQKGRYQDDLQVGQWHSYSPAGYLVEIAHYNERGQRHGRFHIINPDGSLANIRHYKNGLRDGDFWYYHNGQLSSRARYEEDALLDETRAEKLAPEERPGSGLAGTGE